MIKSLRANRLKEIDRRLSHFFQISVEEKSRQGFVQPSVSYRTSRSANRTFKIEGLAAATRSPSQQDSMGLKVRQGISYEPTGLIVESKKPTYVGIIEDL